MSRGLSNSFLSKISRKILGPKFLGVYPCDVRPKTKNRSCFIIFNTGKKNTEGEHFVAVKIVKKEIFYFDPFGEQPNNDYILSFLREEKKNKKFFWNRVQIQDNSSNFCGFFCLAYLISAKNKMPMKRFKNLFSIQNRKLNDKIVIEFIISKIKKK